MRRIIYSSELVTQIFTAAVINAAKKRSEFASIDFEFIENVILGEEPGGGEKISNYLSPLAEKAGQGDAYSREVLSEMNNFFAFVYQAVFEAEIYGYRHEALYQPDFDPSNIFSTLFRYSILQGPEGLSECRGICDEIYGVIIVARTIGEFWRAFDEGNVLEAQYNYRRLCSLEPTGYCFKLLHSQIEALQSQGNPTAKAILDTAFQDVPIKIKERVEKMEKILKAAELVPNPLKHFNLESVMAQEASSAPAKVSSATFDHGDVMDKAFLKTWKGEIDSFTENEKRLFDAALQVRGLKIGFDLEQTLICNYPDYDFRGSHKNPKCNLEHLQNQGIILRPGARALIIGLLAHNNITIVTAATKESAALMIDRSVFLERLIENGTMKLFCREDIVNISESQVLLDEDGRYFLSSAIPEMERGKFQIWREACSARESWFKIPSLFGLDFLVDDNSKKLEERYKNIFKTTANCYIGCDSYGVIWDDEKERFVCFVHDGRWMPVSGHRHTDRTTLDLDTLNLLPVVEELQKRGSEITLKAEILKGPDVEPSNRLAEMSL